MLIVQQTGTSECRLAYKLHGSGSRYRSVCCCQMTDTGLSPTPQRTCCSWCTKGSPIVLTPKASSKLQARFRTADRIRIRITVFSKDSTRAAWVQAKNSGSAQSQGIVGSNLAPSDLTQAAL